MINTSLCADININNLYSHPILLMDSLKSLIGIDLKRSQDDLIAHINSIINLNELIMEINKPISSSNTLNSSISLVSLHDVLKMEDMDKCEKIISEILNVSDGKHILEYLLELSLLQSGYSFIIISSIIRSMEFCDNPDIFKFILLAAKAVILDNNVEPVLDRITNNTFSIENYLLTDFQLIVYGYIIECEKKVWIRENKISNNLNIFRNNVFNRTKNISYKSNYRFTEEIRIYGRTFLLDLIGKVKLNMINHNFLIRLNAIRCLIKNNIADNVCAYYLDKLFLGMKDINGN